MRNLPRDAGSLQDQRGALLPCPRDGLRSGTCPSHLRPGPQLPTLCLERAGTPRGGICTLGCHRTAAAATAASLVPYSSCHLLSSLVTFQSPGEIGSDPESQAQKRPRAAPPWPGLPSSATLQLQAAFSLSLRLPERRRGSVQRRMGVPGQPPPAFSGSSESCPEAEPGAGEVSRPRAPAAGWDGGLGSSEGPPPQQLHPLLSSNLLQNFPPPSCWAGRAMG